MISRIAPFCKMMFPYFATPTLFCFSSQQFSNENNGRGNRKLLKLQECVTTRDLLKFLNRPLSNQHQKLQAIKRMYQTRSSAKPWQKFYNLPRNIESINVSEANAAFLSDICGLIELLTADHVLNYAFFAKVAARIEQLLEKPDLLTDENIINYSYLANQFNFRELNKKLENLLSQRIKNIKIKDFQQFIEVYSKIKIPTPMQRQNFAIFCEKLQSNIQTFKSRILSMCYNSIKTFNAKLWHTQKIQEALESAIKQKLFQLDEKQLGNVLYHRSQLNIFHKSIFNQLIDSIEEDGSCLIDKNTFFKILGKIYFREPYKIYDDRQNKFYKFLLANLDNPKHIILVLEKELLSKQKVENILKEIKNSPYSDAYKKDLHYVYFAVSNNALTASELTNLIENLKNSSTFANQNTRFILQALIVDLLASHDPKNSQIKQLHEAYKQKVRNGIKEEHMFLDSAYFHDYQLIVEFRKRYGAYFLDKIMEQQAASTNVISNSRLAYLIVSNGARQLLNLVRNRKESLRLNQIVSILNKVCVQPSLFKDRFNLIHKCLFEVWTQKEEIPHRERIDIFNYLCNWEVHASLKQNQVSSFLKLAQCYLKNEPKKIPPQIVKNFVSYFSGSPSKYIRGHPEIRNILEIARQNVDIAKTNVNSAGFFSQLVKYDLVTKKLATTIIETIEKHKLSNPLKRYCQFVASGQLNLENLELSSENLLLVVKCKKQLGSFLENNIAQIKEKLKQLRVNQIQTLIISFSMMKTQQSMEIFGCLIDNLRQKLGSRESLKIYFILQNCRRNSITMSGYRELLKSLAENYSKAIRNFSLQLHELLVFECVSKNITCETYLSRIMQHIEQKIKARDISSHEGLKFIEQFMCISDPLRWINLHSFCRWPNEKTRLFDYLSYVDFSEPKAKKDVIKLFESQSQIFLYEGVYHYLVTHVPEIKQFQSKIKFNKFYERKQLCEALVKICQKHNIPNESSEVLGHSMLKIGDKFVFTTRKPYSEKVCGKILRYYTTLFNIFEEKNQNLVLLFNGRNINKRDISRVACAKIPPFKDLRDEVTDILREKVPEAEPEDHENKESPIPAKEQEPKTN